MKRVSVFFAIMMLSMVAFAQSHQLRVATYNVDGLPSSLAGIPIKEGGPGAERSPLIGTKLMEHGWDVVGLNEDFNYHAEIISTMSGYAFQTHQGKFEASLEAAMGILAGTFRFPIDGLMLATKEGFTAKNEDMIPWKDEAVFGYLTNCQDSLTMKGFRYYTVESAEGYSVDFIILHADAGYDHFDRNAREAGMDQLCSYIEGITTQNPLIVIGDYNNLYRRDDMKSLFMDRLNAMNGLVASDVWIEKHRVGEYPSYENPGMDDSKSWDDEGMAITPTSEALDKIVYINRETAPIRLELVSAANAIDFTDDKGVALSDHMPIEATFNVVPNETTGIYGAAHDTSAESSLYNLQGLRVNEQYRGVVLKNRKKYINL